MLSYPEIRGVLAELEEEYSFQKKHPQSENFAVNARYVIAIVDRRIREKIKSKYDSGGERIQF
jgi:hypothetical protein